MSKNYEKYTIEELITDSDFIQWAKYPTVESDIFWQTIATDSPVQADVIQKARMAVQALAIASKQNADTSEIPVIWSEIEQDLNQPKSWYVPIQWKQWAAAASILIILGLGYWWNRDVASKTDTIYVELTSKTSKPIKEVVNITKNKLVISLPDSSKVILEPNSRLSYNTSFEGESREVYLSGEAFFEVKKNPKKPFLVYANALVTKVLGTSFSVKAYLNDKQVTVKVKTGKVSVYQNQLNKTKDPEINGVVLTPNQQGIFEKEVEKLTRTLVEKPTILISNQELAQFSFRDTPVEQIFVALEKAYGVDIIYDKELLTDCHLTTSLTNETLFDKLNIICGGIEATYKVVEIGRAHV